MHAASASRPASTPSTRCSVVVCAAFSCAIWACWSDFSSSRSAQVNSSASMARPIGISTKAGPGVTNNTMPPARISAPTTVKPIR